MGRLRARKVAVALTTASLTIGTMPAVALAGNYWDNDSDDTERLSITLSSPYDYDEGFCDDDEPVSFEISNPSVLEIANETDDFGSDGMLYTYYFKGLKTGTTTVSYTTSDGEFHSADVTVSKGYFKVDRIALYDKFRYGDTSMVGACIWSDDVSISVDSVTAEVGGKTYAARQYAAPSKTSLYDGDDLKKGSPVFEFGKLPVVRIGTKIKLTARNKGTVTTRTIKVPSYKPTLKLQRAFSKTGKVRGYVKGAAKGDKLRVRVGKKTVSKTLAAKKKVSFSFKVKGMKAGSKITATVVNRFGQRVQSKTAKVYYSNDIKVGYTKSQVRNSYYYGAPDYVLHQTPYTAWRYDWDNSVSLIYFKGNRVVQIYEV